MSRTYKDRPARVNPNSWHYYKHEVLWDDYAYIYEYISPFTGERVEVTRYASLKKAGVEPKRRKEQDTEEHWMTTPSWWTRLTMNRPQRRAGRLWERKVLLQDIEETDAPGVSRKPHKYYW